MRGYSSEHPDILHSALRQALRAKNRVLEGILLNNLSSMYDDLGQQEKALDYYQQAMTIQREVGDRWGESVTLCNIGLSLAASLLNANL